MAVARWAGLFCTATCVFLMDLMSSNGTRYSYDNTPRWRRQGSARRAGRSARVEVENDVNDVENNIGQ